MATILLAGLGGGLAALAARESVLAVPGAVAWLRGALEPLGRAGREGYAPSPVEQRRLALVGAIALAGAGLLLAGPWPVPALAAVGPLAAGWAVGRRRARYRRGVERALPEIATALADAIAAGRSVRAGLVEASATLSGPAAAEMARVRTDIELGDPTSVALVRLRRRIGLPAVDSLCAALRSERLGGGDLAGLLRRFGRAASERERIAADARSATAQARFTGLLVVAMPAGAALFGELVEPGFVGKMLRDGSAALLLAAAAVLQIAGFAAIRRLSRMEER